MAAMALGGKRFRNSTHGPLVAAFELLFDDECTQSDPYRMGWVAVVYKLPGVRFLCHIPGDQHRQLDLLIFRIQLAKGESVVVQRHLMVLRIHGTAIQVHSFSPVFGILVCIYYTTKHLEMLHL